MQGYRRPYTTIQRNRWDTLYFLAICFLFACARGAGQRGETGVCAREAGQSRGRPARLCATTRRFQAVR